MRGWVTGEARGKFSPFPFPLLPRVGGSRMINTGVPLSSAGTVTQGLPTRLPSRRVLKSKRILPGEMKFPLFLINP